MNILKRVFKTSHYVLKNDRYRAQVIYAILVAILIFFSFYAVTVAEWSIPGESGSATMIQLATANPGDAPGLVFFSVYILIVLAYYANYVGYQQIAGWTPVLLWLCIATLAIAVGSSPANAGASIIILMLLAGLLIGQDGLIIMGAGVCTMLLIRNASSITFSTAETSVYSVIIQALGAALVVYFMLRYFTISREDAVNQAVSQRQVTADVLQHIADQVAQHSRLTDLLSVVVNQINDSFSYVYHTQVFLIDENERVARLVASTGKVGELLLERQHGLEVGSVSVIGRVTSNGESVIARSGATDSVHRQNELLPETRVEAAFPLRLGNQIIGALDIQSKDPEAFNDPDLIATFQALADSITLAIDNGRQFERAEERLRENERLVLEARKALRQVELLNERLTGQIWSEYLGDFDGQIGLDVDLTKHTSQPATKSEGTLKDAIVHNSLMQQEKDKHQFIAVPLRVRGHVIGAMEFEMEDDKLFFPENIDLLQDVGERFGMAVENARLVDQSQRLAQREALVNQITSRLQASNSVDSMLSEAARSLQTSLKADRVRIRLGAPPVASTLNREDGG